MNALRWLLRSLIFHRRHHCVLAVGALLTAAVLAAALLAGAALNRNLQRLALERIGVVRSAVELRGRWVAASLAERLARATAAPVAPVVRLPASMLAIDANGCESALQGVQAYGVDEQFASFTRDLLPAGEELPLIPPPSLPAPGGILLSRALQAAFPDTGAVLSLRVALPSLFPPEMPFGDLRGEPALRLPVCAQGVQPDHALGALALNANSAPPLNLFANRAWLAAQAGLSNRVNLLLAHAEPAQLAAALPRALRPADLGIATTAATNGTWLVQSERVYLDEAYVRALSALNPAPVLTLHHLVDALVASNAAGIIRSSPYAFVSALSPTDDAWLGAVPAGMADNEILINAWLAEKLALTNGNLLTMQARRPAPGGQWLATTATFRVAGVVPMEACVAERDRMPRFPGLSDVERCADWEIGLPMDAARLADPDNEAYWKAFGPTPKAFLTYAAGQRLFGSYLGSTMTARLPPEITAAAIEEALCRAAPDALGLAVRPVRQEALQAAAQAMDFRLLFGGMAGVLMIAALLLTGMLAAQHVSYRREEVGILRAAGLAPWRLVWLWMTEALVPLLLGTGAGVALGGGAAYLLVASLNRFWSDAVAATPMAFLLDGRSAAVAGVVALVLALLAVGGGIARALRHPVLLLLGDQPEEAVTPGDRAWTIRNFSLGMSTAMLAIALLAAGNRADAALAGGIFFGAGLLLMISLLSWARLLAHFVGSRDAATGPLQAGLRNVTRHPGRSLLVMTLLATGSFLTVGILAMQHDPADSLRHTDSGSGGMTALVELTLPQPGGRCEERLRRALGDAGIVLSFRVREGDEAGCLNLQRAQQPRLLGVALDEAQASRAFVPAGEPSAFLWRPLLEPLPDGTIPVLAGDRTTLEYGLHAQTGVQKGTVYTYAGEDGRVWRLRVVGALPVRTGVLQGSLLLNESFLAQMAPSAPGRTFWLVRDAGAEEALVARLRQELGRNGARVTPARERLRLLGGVELAYLEMFLVLGGLGMVLGAAGVGVVVLRQAATRRRELALFEALGLPVWQVWRYWMAEYLYLLVAGLTAGVLPALVAMQPALRTLGQALPVGVMAGVILAMGCTGLLGITLAVRATTRLPLPAALRGE
jgi:hypothetical protein